MFVFLQCTLINVYKVCKVYSSSPYIIRHAVTCFSTVRIDQIRIEIEIGRKGRLNYILISWGDCEVFV